MSNNRELIREPSAVRAKYASQLEKASQAVGPLKGSLGEHFQLNAEARQKCVKALHSPQTPSQLVAIAGLDPYSPHSSESVSRFLSELEKSDCVEIVKDEQGRLRGWRLKIVE